MASTGVSRVDREASLQKRQRNYEYAIALFLELSVPFEVMKDWRHLVVRYKGKVADFWPTTGQYAIRCAQPVYRRGIRKLLEELDG